MHRLPPYATGVGVLNNRHKSTGEVFPEAVESMAALNDEAAREALRDGFVSGGTRRNLDWVRPHLAATVADEELVLLADAQTSGWWWARSRVRR